MNGGDLVSTWVTKLKAHAEDVANLVKNVTNLILANTSRKLVVAKSRKPSNDGKFVELAKAA
jgi:hypothetical protein